MELVISIILALVILAFLYWFITGILSLALLLALRNHPEKFNRWAMKLMPQL